MVEDLNIRKSPIGLYSAHILTSAVLLAMVIGILYLIRVMIADVLMDPPWTLLAGESVLDFNFKIIFICLISISVLCAFIFYLLLTFRSRFEFQVWNEIKVLAIAKQQFEKLYESAPVPYLMLDKDGNINKPNKAALRFFGVYPEDIEGKNLFSYLAGEYKDKAEEFFKLYKSNIPINRKEAQMITRNGAVKSIMLTVFDMRGPSSIFRTGLAVLFDISEQKQIEKTKTEFLSLASHQLRTPMATTKWYTEALMSGDLGELAPAQKKYIEVLHTTNQEMVELVDVLLNISRIEMGSLKMEKIATNVAELAESVFKELAMQINAKKIHIDRKFNDLFVDVKSDPKLLRVIIQNLVSNAVKYTPEDGTITMSFEENNSERRITVADTGYGIPKDQQGRVFSKLFRADNIKNLTNSQGTGLGLYLVKSIAVSMGGDIRFSSEENKGSVFTIIF